MSSTSHWQWLQEKHGKPIYMQDVDPLVPDSVKFPLEEIQAEIPELAKDYFDLSVAYALLFAVLKCKYSEIHVYGMDLVSGTEYIYQANCWRSWLMWCWGRGANVVMHCNEGLFGHRKYGYDGEVELGVDFFAERETRYQAEYDSADKNLTNTRKAVERSIEKKNGKLPELLEGYKNSARLTGQLSGKLFETQRFKDAGARAIYRQDFEKRMAACKLDGEVFNNRMLMAMGKIEYVYNVWLLIVDQWKKTGQPGQLIQAEAQLKGFLMEMGKNAYDLGAHEGGYQENFDYMAELDRRIQAAGGAKSVQVMDANAHDQLLRAQRESEAAITA